MGSCGFMVGAFLETCTASATSSASESAKRSLVGLSACRPRIRGEKLPIEPGVVESVSRRDLESDSRDSSTLDASHLSGSVDLESNRFIGVLGGLPHESCGGFGKGGGAGLGRSSKNNGWKTAWGSVRKRKLQESIMILTLSKNLLR